MRVPNTEAVLLAAALIAGLVYASIVCHTRSLENDSRESSSERLRESDIRISRAHCLARVRLELSPLGLVGDAETSTSALEVLDGIDVHTHEGAIAVERSSGTSRFRYRCRMARGVDRTWLYLEFTVGPERRSP